MTKPILALGLLGASLLALTGVLFADEDYEGEARARLAEAHRMQDEESAKLKEQFGMIETVNVKDDGSFSGTVSCDQGDFQRNFSGTAGLEAIGREAAEHACSQHGLGPGCKVYFTWVCAPAGGSCQDVPDGRVDCTDDVRRGGAQACESRRQTAERHAKEYADSVAKVGSSDHINVGSRCEFEFDGNAGGAGGTGGGASGGAAGQRNADTQKDVAAAKASVDAQNQDRNDAFKKFHDGMNAGTDFKDRPMTNTLPKPPTDRPQPGKKGGYGGIKEPPTEVSHNY